MLVRRISSGAAAELVGAAALVWVAAEDASTVADLASQLAVDDATIEAAVELLLSAGWLSEAAP